MKRIAIDFDQTNHKYLLITYLGDKVSSIEEFTDYQNFMDAWNIKTYELLFG